MRQKNTVYHPVEHIPGKETPDGIRIAKEKKAESWKKDEKQGQSDFRTKKFKG